MTQSSVKPAITAIDKTVNFVDSHVDNAVRTAKRIVEAAQKGRSITEPGLATSIQQVRDAPTPVPVLGQMLRTLVNPEDEKLYQAYLTNRRLKDAQYASKYGDQPLGLSHPREFYSAALNDIAGTREEVRQAQTSSRVLQHRPGLEKYKHPTGYEYHGLETEGHVLSPNTPPMDALSDFRYAHPEMSETELQKTLNLKNWVPPDSPPLTRVDHGLQAMKDYYRGTPRAAQLLRVLAYNAAKGAAQNAPESVAPGVERWLLNKMGNVSDMSQASGALREATPPSFQSILWGLRPFWARD